MYYSSQGGKIDLGVALPLNIGCGGTLIDDLPWGAAVEVIGNGIAVEIKVQMRLVRRANREVLQRERDRDGTIGQSGVVGRTADRQNGPDAGRQVRIRRTGSHTRRWNLWSGLGASRRHMTEIDGASSIHGKHVAARIPEKHRVDVAPRDEEQAKVRADEKIAERPDKLALRVRRTSGRVIFRDDLIAGVHRHDASARDGPADRDASLGRGSHPSPS